MGDLEGRGLSERESRRGTSGGFDKELQRRREEPVGAEERGNRRDESEEASAAEESAQHRVSGREGARAGMAGRHSRTNRGVQKPGLNEGTSGQRLALQPSRHRPSKRRQGKGAESESEDVTAGNFPNVGGEDHTARFRTHREVPTRGGRETHAGHTAVTAACTRGMRQPQLNGGAGPTCVSRQGVTL